MMLSDASVVSLTSDQHFSMHALTITNGQSMYSLRRVRWKDRFSVEPKPGGRSKQVLSS